jgi:predicted ATP-grasp superfamily ATP-dependent carboligase
MANPVRAAAGWPPVVVAGAFQTGVVLMRNLARRGLKVYAFDCIPTQPGFKTVYGQTFLCPNPDDEPEAWISFMLELARKIGGKPVLIPSADQFVTAIAAHVPALEQHFIFCQSGSSVQALLATKKRQYEIAATHGLPTARTQFVRSLKELEAFASTARFPCLIKPLHCREWERMPEKHPLRNSKLGLAASPSELIEQYQSVSAFTPELVVQEVIEGPDTAKLCYMSCYSRSGKRLGSCVVRQVRTTPIYFGSASIVEPVLDPEVDTLSDQFLKSIGYAGLCELELKRDTRDGQVKLIEANPRYSVTSDAAPYAGVDIGWLHYLDLIGIDVEPVHQLASNYRHIVLHRDFATFRSYRRAGLMSWGGFLRSYRPPVHFFDFDLRDWRVTWSSLVDLFKILVGPYIRRVFPKRA